MLATIEVVAAAAGAAGGTTLLDAAVIAAVAGGFFALVTSLVQTKSHRSVERMRIDAETRRELMRLNVEAEERDRARAHELAMEHAKTQTTVHGDRLSRLTEAATTLVPTLLPVVGYFQQASLRLTEPSNWRIGDSVAAGKVTYYDHAFGAMHEASLLHPDPAVRSELRDLYDACRNARSQKEVPSPGQFGIWAEDLRDICEAMQVLTEG